jgi:hypothetical protein
MTIPDEIRKCVGFVGFQMADGSVRLAGTVFFVRRQIQGLDRMFTYAITAKHVVQKIKDKGLDGVLLRLNVKGLNALWAKSKMEDWHIHPDPTVDVAVMRFGLTDQMDHKVFPLEGAATNAVIANHQIGIGDEVFLAGLFSPHYGKKNNIPIVRVGNIAAMPQEKVNTHIGEIDAYLIEARSIGGLSGSPVFVQIGGMRHGVVTVSSGLQFFLLGLMHGHFDSQILQKDATEDTIKAETVNMGIGIVVPVEKIMETINQPKISDAEKQEVENFKKQNLPTMDTAPEVEGSFTKADFEDALRKVSRKTEPQK